MVIQFLWNWADILGCRPGLRRYASCGKEFPEPEVAATLWYSRHEAQLVCSSCSGLDEDIRDLTRVELSAEFLPVGPSARRWLLAAEKLGPEQIGRIGIDGISRHEAKTLCAAILSAALRKRLSSWNW